MPLTISSEEFKQIYSKVPRLCLEVAIFTQDGLLLTRRAIPPHVGAWHTPGGGLLFGETLAQGVQRIAKVELGVEVVPGEVAGYIEYPMTSDFFGHSISLVYYAELLSEDIKLDYQADAYQFFKELPENMIPEMKNFFKALPLKTK